MVRKWVRKDDGPATDMEQRFERKQGRGTDINSGMKRGRLAAFVRKRNQTGRRHGA